GFAVVRRQHVADVLRVRLVRARGRVDEVDEQHRDELPLLLRRPCLAQRRAAVAAEPRPGRVRLAAVLAEHVDGGHPAKVSPTARNRSNWGMDFPELVRTRRTHKSFGPEPLQPELVDELLELARWAPNHHRTNPWRFRVVGPETLERLKEAAGPAEAPKLDRARTLVIVSCVLSGDLQQDEQDISPTPCPPSTLLLPAPPPPP